MCIKVVYVFWNGFVCGLFGGSNFVPETLWVVDFLASSLACSSAVALHFFVWSEPCILSLLSRSYSVLGCSQGALAHV